MDKNIFRLMIIPVGILFCGLILIFLHNRPMLDGITISDFRYFPWLIVAVLIAFFLEFAIVKFRKKKDGWLFPCAFFLTSFGIVIIGRLDESLIVPQIRWFILGMIAFFITFRFETLFRKMLKYKYFWGFLFFVFLMIPMFLGVEINGISSSVMLGNFRIQPFEFTKILLVIFLASYLSEKEEDNTFLRIFVFALYTIFASAFIFTKDFGNATVLFLTTLIMTHVVTGKKLWSLFSIIFFLSCMAASYYAFPHVKSIFDVWLNPWADASGVAKKIFESFFAFGEGGVWGAGFTMGRPDFIPEADTSLIVSAVAEEFGLVGIISVVIVYSLLFYQSVLIAFNLKNEAEILLAFGVGILFFFQTFLSTASALNILPGMGIFLPFMSYGGSAVVSNFVLLGILASLSRKEKFNG